MIEVFVDIHNVDIQIDILGFAVVIRDEFGFIGLVNSIDGTRELTHTDLITTLEHH